MKNDHLPLICDDCDYELPFTELHRDQEEALHILIEECSEVIKAATKVLRYGLDTTHPSGGRTNVQDIAVEFGHAIAALDFLGYANIAVDYTRLNHARMNKHDTVQPFIHHLRIPRPTEEQQRVMFHPNVNRESANE